ncbi:MAG TPA: TIM barrel protein [Fimbriimonadaceae bacterium]|nr:TIM barrel protein [Fimbriimonadaceae bacterium]
MKLSVQCYTLREEFARDPWGTFKALRAMGLNYVELAGTYGLSAQELKDGLDEIGLRVSGAHIGLAQLRSELHRVIADAHTLENPYVILPWVGPPDYEQGWDVLAKECELIAQRLADAGLKFAYHNHDFEFALQDGTPGLDVFYASSDPSLVLAQLDLYWIKAGGGDPEGYIRKYKKRVPLVHLKDMSAGENPTFIEGGRGILDWDGILAACRDNNVEFGAIELDVCPNPPLESVRTSVEFFRGKGF